MSLYEKTVFCVYNYEEENNISQKGENSDQLNHTNLQSYLYKEL